jgi:ABC-type Fe3+-hydroxamate transport system substrate-binding protein
MILKSVKDALQRDVSFTSLPQRVVSLVPSITETIFDMGLSNQLAGRTAFCIHPANKVKKIPIIGGTKTLRTDKIERINPDLILAVREENSREDIERVWQKLPVYVFDIHTIGQALDMIATLGGLLGHPRKGINLRKNIEKTLKPFPDSGLKVLYLIWKNPFMAAGKATFIDSVLTHAGFENFINEEGYPRVEDVHIEQANLVMLSSEPYHFKTGEVKEMKVTWGDKFMEVDGEIFSWYGSHMQKLPYALTGIREQIRIRQANKPAG